MTSPPNETSLPKSRGHSLFDRQAQLHAQGSNLSSNQLHTSIHDTPVSKIVLKSWQSMPTPLAQSSYMTNHHSPSIMHRHLPTILSETYLHSTSDNVQLLSINPRPELTYIKDVPATIVSPETLLETDFPLIENASIDNTDQANNNHSLLSDTTCAALVEQAFDYLKTHDDDDDVIHQANDNEQQYYSDSFDGDDNDSVETIDLATSKMNTNDRTNSKSILFLASLRQSYRSRSIILLRYIEVRNTQ
jgi:hypothetical protein